MITVSAGYHTLPMSNHVTASAALLGPNYTTHLDKLLYNNNHWMGGKIPSLSGLRGRLGVLPVSAFLTGTAHALNPLSLT